MKDIKELLQYHPRLYKDGFTPIKRWCGGNKGDGVATMPLPEYEQDVIEFMREASKKCWCDYQYDPATASEMLENPKKIESATIEELKTMLTCCVRGERFCDGHMGAMITDGKIKLILIRLDNILKEDY